MHTPFKRHLLELHKRHLIELTAFAREYGGDGFGASGDAFPRSSADVMAATAMCFDDARQALDAAQTGARVRENMRAPSTEHVASVASKPFIALLREVEQAQTTYNDRLRAIDEAILHSSSSTLADQTAPRFLPYLLFNVYLYWRPSPLEEGGGWTVAEYLVYLTTAQPALLRATYVWHRGNTDLALRMFAGACDHVEGYDEHRDLARSMRYTLAQMYRRAQRYLEAITALRRVIALDRTHRR